MTTQLHEDLRRESEEPRASEPSFGFVFAAVFALIAFWPLVRSHDPRWWAAALSAAFLVLAIAAPRALTPLNRVWAGVGRLLNRIVSPIVMAALYVVAVVPTGLALRLAGKDPLRLKFDPKAGTYWQPRTPPGPAADSFKNQF